MTMWLVCNAAFLTQRKATTSTTDLHCKTRRGHHKGDEMNHWKIQKINVDLRKRRAVHQKF